MYFQGIGFFILTRLKAMKNFIEELYYGNINPQERYFDCKSETGKSIYEKPLNDVFFFIYARFGF